MTRPWLALVALATPLAAQSPADFFESKIRPVMAVKCYTCHSSKLSSPMGGLVLDTKSGLRKGGGRGPALVPGKPGESRIVQALRYTDTHLQMPPTGKLPDAVIADFEQWIATGAPDPREETAATAAPAPLKGMDVETGRKWWAFQPVQPQPAPAVQDKAWPRTKIDSFLLARLEEAKLKPSARADARTLARRAYIDLIGVKPTYEEVEAFASDASPDAYARLIERLLASPHYGERWGRHWLDVARYAEDNPTSEATNPPFAYAWRYRDWVIEAVNQDLPYDRFVKMQLAADLLPGAKRADLRALGYLGVAPVYHKEPRLSQEVLYTFATDDWDERIDAVSRGLLGITVACARCHDHKFDPIPTKDYYGLAGVFASTMRTERPLRDDIDPKTETRYLWIEQRLFDLNVIAGILANENQTNPEWAARRLAEIKDEMLRLQAEVQPLKDRYPELVRHVARLVPPLPRPPVPPAAAPAAAAQRRRAPGASTEPFINAVYDAALYVDGKDPFMTEMDYRPGEARDIPVLLHGSVASPGEMVPRHFLSVLSEGDGNFRNGSGRLELADKIFSDAAPLSARVIVNRVWDWHFGKALVGTTSDFGTQGEKPSHPELLEDLAARFIANGWSLKWLHREIVLSAAYQQASRTRPEGEQIDQVNRLVWRMNPRRLDIEAYRDSLLRASGTLQEELYGPSIEFDSESNNRRTVYARVSRGRLNTVLRLYDFPDPMQTSPGRDLTTTPLQQLFVFNSPFIQQQAATLAKSVASEPDTPAKVRSLYRRVLARDPSPKELDLAASYLTAGTLAQYAQALLSTNEEIFWP